MLWARRQWTDETVENELKRRLSFSLSARVWKTSKVWVRKETKLMAKVKYKTYIRRRYSHYFIISNNKKIKMIVNTVRVGYPWLTKPKPDRTVSSHVNPKFGPANPFFSFNPARFGFCHRFLAVWAGLLGFVAFLYVRRFLLPACKDHVMQ
jgi:hypothetical protein